MRIGVYPGTFDPITLGHMDIIRRGAKLVDRLVIGVTTNITKSPMFDDEERLAMVRREVEGIDGDIRVVGFNSLLMDFAEREGATVIVRGGAVHGNVRASQGIEIHAPGKLIGNIHSPSVFIERGVEFREAMQWQVCPETGGIN